MTLAELRERLAAAKSQTTEPKLNFKNLQKSDLQESRIRDLLFKIKRNEE